MKRFPKAFSLLFGCFLIANGISYFIRSDGHGLGQIHDGIRAAGFPFLVYEAGGVAGIKRFSYSALFENAALAFCISAYAAWLYSKRRT